MRYQTMLPIAAALTLALGAGCERRSTEDMSGTTRTTAGTTTPETLRDASVTGMTATPGGIDTSGMMGPYGPGGTDVSGTSDTSGATGTTTVTQGTMQQAVKPIDQHDKDFISKAAGGSIGEIALATAATQKATSPELKSFAEKLVNDHTKAKDELESLASKKGVTLPADVPKDEKSEQDRLAKLSGKKFDKEYADFMVKDQEHDVKTFQKAAKEVKDPDIKAWAEKMVPILQGHLDTAKDVDKKIKH